MSWEAERTRERYYGESYKERHRTRDTRGLDENRKLFVFSNIQKNQRRNWKNVKESEIKNLDKSEMWHHI